MLKCSENFINCTIQTTNKSELKLRAKPIIGLLLLLIMVANSNAIVNRSIIDNSDPVKWNHSGVSIEAHGVPPSLDSNDFWWDRDIGSNKSSKGKALFSQGKYDEAIKAFDEAIRLDPTWAAHWNNKGVALIHQGDTLHKQSNYYDAIKAFDEAIRLDSNDTLVWSNKGSALNRLGKYDEALKACNKSIELNPKNPVAWYNRANAFTYMGNFEEATKSLNDGLKLVSNYPPLWYAKGLAFEAQGQSDQAVLCYANAVEIDPDYAEAWNSKISALKKLGRYDEADNSYFIYRYNHRSIYDYLAWLSCGFGVRWQYTIYSGIWLLLLFGSIYFLMMLIQTGINKEIIVKQLLDSIWFSAVVLLSVPSELYPNKADTYKDYAKKVKYHLPILERLLGWGLVVLFINTLSRVMLHL